MKSKDGKMRVLIVVPPERFDFYNYLETEKYEYILLWHVKKSDEKFQLYELPLNFSKEVFWSDYATPDILLTKINPDKIVFFEIIDTRQIALIVTAKAKKITTFYLEHGAAGNRETAIKRWNEQNFTDHKMPYYIKRIKNNFSDIISSKYFYYSVSKGFNSFKSYLKYLITPVQMLKSLPNKVLSHNKFIERVPKYSIVFNKVNYEQFELYTGIKEEDALLTGVPFFDKFYSNECIEENYIVFIDHPYLEENILGWNDEYHHKMASSLEDFAVKNRTKVYIKLHPLSNKVNWERYKLNTQFIEILQMGAYTDLYLKAKLILGFSSSLLNGLICAKKNVVLLGWHPIPQIFGVDYSEYGICHKSMSIDEINTMSHEWLKVNKCYNDELYHSYLKRFNYPFDGKATERVISAIGSLSD